MEGFLRSFAPLIAKFKIELMLVITAILIGIFSLGIYIISDQKNKQETDLISFQENTANVDNIEKIFVDLSGSVEKPDIYEVSSEARLRDVLIIARGLSKEADRDFFNKNFNLAKKLKDQEKIYIPSKDEVKKGITLATSKDVPNNFLGTDEGKISINTASIDQLDSLSGIGKITAQKIIQNRPYTSLSELVSRKIIYQSLFDKIKDQIDL